MVATAPFVRCAACKEQNTPGALFCQRCTAPVGIVSLKELTSDDQRTCLSALFRVLADGPHSGSPLNGLEDSELWNSYLSAFWLRPETALILYAEALAMRRFSTIAFAPWLDLGCGDGIHAALYSGWRFSADFDAFQSLDPAAADIYHHWNPVDFSASVAHRTWPIDFGIDIKPTAIARADALGVFDATLQADATALPLPDRSVGTIFSNMLRDLGDPLPAALAECRRVLRNNGVLLLSTMTPAYAGNLYFAPAAREANAAGNRSLARKLLRLDRGRSVFCQQQLSIADWSELLKSAGLRIVDVSPIVGPAIVRFWDVGARPFSIPLLRQRQAWAETGQLLPMKELAVQFISQTLSSLLGRLTEGEPCMNLLAVMKA